MRQFRRSTDPAGPAKDGPCLQPRKGRAFPQTLPSTPLTPQGMGLRSNPSLNPFCVEIWLAESSLDKVLRRSVDDNAWDEESDEVWRGMDRSSRYGRALWPRETESLPERLPFASMRKTLLDDLPRRVATCSDNSQRRLEMTSSSHTSSHTSSFTLRRTLRRLFQFGGLSMAPLPLQ
jgi:hypothetical protein